MAEWFEWQEAPASDFCVVGDPIAHSLSPAMHSAIYRALALPYRYVAVRIPRGHFDQALERLVTLGYRGVNVTLPLKEEAFSWAIHGDPRLGSVNTLRCEDRAGLNTDAPGLLATLAELGIAPTTTLLLGAGGTARALCVALCDAGHQVRVFNRTESKAHQMVEMSQTQATVVTAPDPADCGLVINATSAGHRGDTVRVDWERGRPGVLAYDISYGPAAEPFLASARSQGVRVVDGKGLLVAQGALSFEWWTGLDAPRTAMMQAIV